MASNRWAYQVVELKPKLFGGSLAKLAQERLTQLGLQGWELVSAVQPHQLAPMYLYLKKES
ncbi:DUF4177 domain-containing protein [Cognatiluteimonas lumbrici]|uniref:DUF4177 domain-containing protein n=1 Tax=Cognatiluteimonas lumbrici TaxID=2559601 RepID=UPI00112D3DE3|nr:DUF4177 domain-containing protein [Luteimonas lumbrici]